VGDHHGGDAGCRVPGQPQRTHHDDARGRLAASQGPVAGGGPALEADLPHPAVGQIGHRRLRGHTPREPAAQGEADDQRRPHEPDP